MKRRAPMRSTIAPPTPPATPATRTVFEEEEDAVPDAGAGVTIGRLTSVSMLAETLSGVMELTPGASAILAMLICAAVPFAKTTSILTSAVASEKDRSARPRRLRRPHCTLPGCTLSDVTWSVWYSLMKPCTKSSSVSRIVFWSAGMSWHASSAVSCSCTANVATRSSGTENALAIIVVGVVAKVKASAPRPDCPSLRASDVDVDCRSIRRRRFGPGSPAMLLPGSPAMPSSRVMRAKRMSFCEIEKSDAPLVCVGVHSYPGLIQYARRYRPLRVYADEITPA
mmetsp:Transcript_30355/g.46694  ORF Transcript_30355/g.46694 Transcript_30355/m.46694 type:complete len:283 (-) Transcript_30355:729-1577(-)